MRSTLTLILTILATFCQGECPIECYCERVTTCSGDKLLTRLPKISPNLNPIRLEFHSYSLFSLNRKDFLGLLTSSNITEFSLIRSSLQSLGNETFSLSGENLEESDTPESLLSLRILDLSQNKLQYFVGGGLLRRIRILDLSSNILQQVYNLPTLSSLESVNLRDNRISFLEPEIFQGLKHLQYINLDANVLGLVDPSTFSNLPALAHLILSSNPLSNLAPGFLWNSRVQFVDVSRVGLTFVPASLTASIRDFRCANNNLTFIRQTDFESYPNLGLLVLDENQIEVVEDDAFGRLDFLTRLWMNGNRLTRTPQNLPPSLLSLHLEDNRIANLSSTDFRNLRSLGELNLGGNKIASLAPFIFSELESLRSLDLRSNEIDVLYRDSFSNLSKLQTLDLSSNPIKVIVTGAFGSLLKVSLLHLTRLREPISFDPTSLQNLQNLQILELEDSPHLAQLILQGSSLSQLPKLRELNIQRCLLSDLSLVSEALSVIGNLRVLKMSGNPWDCGTLKGLLSFLPEVMKKRALVDQPRCDVPEGLKGVLVASLNFSETQTESPSFPSDLLEGEEEEENLLDFTELTGSVLDQDQEKEDKVTNAWNTNSPENLPHVSNANPASATSTEQSQLPGESESEGKNLPKVVAMAKADKAAGNATFGSSNSNTNTSTGKESATNRPVDSSRSIISEGTHSISEVGPTRSYFEPVIEGRTNSISSIAQGNKKPGTPWSHPDKTKTNDDNTIIDEGGGRSDAFRREDGEGPKSIDGFPSDVDGLSSSSEKSRNKGVLPKAFHLRRGKSESGESSSASGAIIIKTIVISAVACLLSVLVLFGLSLFFYKVTKNRRRGRAFNCAISCRKAEEEDPHCHYSRSGGNGNSKGTGTNASRKSYTRFGEEGEDHVELGGITNRLYLETSNANEEIYHIT